MQNNKTAKITDAGPSDLEKLAQISNCVRDFSVINGCAVEVYMHLMSRYNTEEAVPLYLDYVNELQIFPFVHSRNVPFRRKTHRCVWSRRLYRFQFAFANSLCHEAKDERKSSEDHVGEATHSMQHDRWNLNRKQITTNKDLSVYIEVSLHRWAGYFNFVAGLTFGPVASAAELVSAG